MKRHLSLVLAAVLIAASLVSCAGVAPKASLIRTTSSDAESAAAWLEQRLGDRLSGRVVIGTDASGYGVDVSALADDGFLIRTFGCENVLFARTEAGLDRAARKYAHMAEAGAVEDTTYHEGYRVKKLTIAGNDVSDYAIVRVVADDPCVATAAAQLAEYIEKTCGELLPVCTEADFASTGRSHKIAISSGDEALGDEGFSLAVEEDGTLTVAGGVWRGSLYGVYGLLEDMGWRFLASEGYYREYMPLDKQEYLYESEHVDLTPAINRTEIPSVAIRGGVGGKKQRNSYVSYQKSELGGWGFIIRACHGLQNNHALVFSGEFEGLYLGLDVTGKQPCYSDENILEAIDAYALSYVQTRLDAGQQIGREIIAVDVSMWDGGPWFYCDCKNCQRIEVQEKDGWLSHTGPYLRMANRVAALLDEEYPGVCAAALAYNGTDKLPAITRPAHNLYIAYCFYTSGDYVTCSNHCISGEDCPDQYISNKAAARKFEQWMDVMDPAMMQVWYYPFNYDNLCYNAPIYKNIDDDMRYLASYDVGQVYLCCDNNDGLICESLSRYIASKVLWDETLTDADCEALMLEWFRLAYGEAGDLLYDLTIMAEMAGDLAGCWCSFYSLTLDRVDYEYVARHADTIKSVCERAVAMAADGDEEAMIEKYTAGFLYMILHAQYEDMYLNGTDEERAEVTELYRRVWELFQKHDLNTFPGKYVEGEFDPDHDPRSWKVGS